MNQQQTPDNNNIMAEAQPIKAEEQLGQLGGLVESGQAQELDYDDNNQSGVSKMLLILKFLKFSLAF